MGNLQNSILNRSKKQGDFRNTAILALGNGYLWFDRVMVMMAFPFVLPAFGLTLSQGGLIVSAMAIGFIICGLVFGNISDRIGRRKVYIPAIAVFSVGGFLTGLAGNIIALAGIRAVVCGAEGAYNSAAQAQVSERSMPEKKGQEHGILCHGRVSFSGFSCSDLCHYCRNRIGLEMDILPYHNPRNYSFYDHHFNAQGAERKTGRSP